MTDFRIDEAALEEFQYTPLNHGTTGIGIQTTSWKCRQCKQRVEVAWVKDQELVCPECGCVVPTPESVAQRVFAKLPERDQKLVFRKITEALLWRGWDDKCRCHACGAVRDIAELFVKNGMEMEEYT